jgi:hypothetical protein
VQKKLEADGEKHRQWVLWKSSVGGGDTIVGKGEMDKEDMKMIQCSKYSTLQTPFISPPPPLSQAVLLAHTSALCIQTSFRGFLVSVLNLSMEAPLPVFKTTVFRTLSCTVDN